MQLEIKENVDNTIKKSGPTLCLNMIVKNESRIITRLFDSVFPIIDCYCICDTGSTDNTVELIKNYFSSKNIPGKVVQEPFMNFAYNRTFSLLACQGMSDYVILLDADMILKIGNFDKEKLRQADSCCLLQGNDSYYYKNMRIVKNNGLYKYIGVTHEYVDVPPGNHNIDISKDQLFILDIGDGGAKTDKFERDVRLLLKGIEDEPNNVRYHFYLANSYKDSGQFEKAIEYYKKRIEMKDWEQEVWYSNYNIANIYEHLGKMGDAFFYWLEAYNVNPKRLENIYKIVTYYRNNGKSHNAKIFYDAARSVIKQSVLEKDNFLFLENDVYTYKLDYEFTVFASYVGVTNVGPQINSVFNNCDDLNFINNVLSNMKFYKHVLTAREKLDLSFTEERKVGDNNISFYSSSCSILEKQDKSGYYLNTRLVNYVINRQNNYYSGCEQHIITNNKFIEMTKDLKVTREKIFDVEYENRHYLGIEDIRIFYDDKNPSKLIFAGTSEHKNGKIGMLIGDYDVDSQFLSSTEISPSFCDSWCEKNWVFVRYRGENRMIYKWNPLQIGRVNPDTNQLDIVETREKMPKIFNHSRGSTPGVYFNNEYWFILHLVSYETPRHYYHFIAVFDADLNFLRHTAPFKFEGEAIEYCLGIVVEEHRLLATYSTWDGSTHLAVYDKSYIDGLF